MLDYMFGLEGEVVGDIFRTFAARVLCFMMVKHEGWRFAGNEADGAIVVWGFRDEIVAGVGVVAEFHVDALPARPVYSGWSYARRVSAVDDAVSFSSVRE